MLFSVSRAVRYYRFDSFSKIGDTYSSIAIYNMRYVRRLLILSRGSFRNFHASAANFANAAPSTSSQPETCEYRPVIGLEVHAQISAKSKLFSSAASNYWASSNTMVNFLDCALPGTLPMLNRRCVEAGILTALALNCRINLVSMFDRKHYFYSDLPAGYQITQQRQPIAVDGWVEYIVHGEDRFVDPYVKKTKIIQVQLEQDSGKSIHDTANQRSLVDLNRAGVALLEIVCDHNLESELEASCFAKELHLILRKIGVCEGRMERGQFRVDANISVHRPDEPLGQRTEVKNLNSFRFIQRALNYEIGRQIDLRKAGEKILNETLAFDFRTGKTSPMRDKEVRQDYRYMPEPNLPPLILDDSLLPDQEPEKPKGIIDVDELRKKLPMLPASLRAQWIEKFGLSLADCVTLNDHDNIARAFDRLLAENNFQPGRTLRALSLYVESLAAAKIPWESSRVEWPILVEAVQLLLADRISEYVFRQVFEIMFKNPKKTPTQIIQEQNLFVLEDDTELERMCEAVIKDSKKTIRKFESGQEEKAIRKFVRVAGTKLQWRYPEWKIEKIVREKLAG